VRVKLRKIQGNLNIFRGKERVKYEIYEKEGKVRVKIVSEISKWRNRGKSMKIRLSSV
jgi:hypothetical protein